MEYKEKVIALLNSKELSKEQKEKLESIFPELKESENENVRKEIISYIKANVRSDELSESWIAWLENQKTSEEALQYLRENHSSSEMSDFQAAMNIAVAKAYDKGYNDGLEKQGEIDKISYEIAEKEKREFVGGGFIKCYADFQDFKERETYWLEYVGNDNYNVRSDNLLGKTYHITPCQLYTIFKKQTWLEKQGETFTKKDVDDAYLKGVCDTKHELEKQGEQKPAWSEEDENLFEEIKRCVGIQYPLGNPCIFKFLKSLKDRYTWKPSDLQIKALEYYIKIGCIDKEGFFGGELVKLLEELKKLN